jgi:hypothetical protein
MNTEHLTLENHLKRTTKVASVISGLIATLGSVGVVYSFYYSTRGTLLEHDEAIKEVKTDVSQIKVQMTNAAVFEGVSKAQYKALEDKVNSIDNKMDKIGDKLDQILIRK